MYLNKFCFEIYKKSKTVLSTYITRLFCANVGIRVGVGCKFRGLPYIEKVNGSMISIGDYCVFNSAFTSNEVGIYSRCRLQTLTKSANIEIEKNVGLSGVSITCAAHIIIKERTLIGANVLITDTDSHSIDPAFRNCGIEYANSKPITISENVFIGTRSVVLKGVTIGRNSIIGAGSVVNKDIPENSIAAGNPCQVIRSL